MSKHLCHWTRKDMRRVADACEQLDVDIEHVIVLDLLSEPESSIFDDPVDDLLDAEGPEELEAVFGKPLGGHVYKAGAGPEGSPDAVPGMEPPPAYGYREMSGPGGQS